MPKKVYAHLHYGKWHDIEVEDDVTAYLEFENGATGVFVTSTGDARGTNRFEIQMDGAKLVVEKNKLWLTEYKMTEQEFSRTAKEAFGVIEATEYEVETDSENPQHIGVLNKWGESILNGTPLVADGSEGINGLTLSNAMHLSSFLDKPIEIPFDEDLFYSELMKKVAVSRRKENVNQVFSDTSDSYGGAN